MRIQLLFVVLAVFFAHSALAQQFYKWKDEKGQWHYWDFPSSGVPAEKLGTGDTPQTLEAQPSVSPTGEQRKTEDSSGRSIQGASDVDPFGSAPRYLLVFPPFDPGKPLSEWIPVESFDSAGECTRALQFGVSIVESTDFPRDTRASVHFGTLNSRCISLAEFKPLKEANVIVAVTSIGSTPADLALGSFQVGYLTVGGLQRRTFVVRYRVRDARGIIYANGEILPTPQNIPPLTFAEYRGQILGSVGGSDRWLETEAKWSKN